jgi:type VI secretion system protein ImpF
LARARQEVLVTQSLIDRLCDIEPWPESRSASISMFQQSLRRDIEWLLNTRKPHLEGIEAYPLTSGSVLHFGLPDSRVFGSSAAANSGALARVIEECIEEFEPRILEPHVTLTLSDNVNRSLRFQVEGKIIYEEMEEEIHLDTVLELISGQYEVG